MLAELQREFARELLSDGARLRVHRQTTLAALAGALEATYPVCARLVGAEFFGAAARRFAREVPSRSPDLCDYGAELAGWLAAFEPARALPYLADVARLEWALHRARHAAAPESHDPARVAFRAAPGTAFLDSPWPVDRIWETNQPDFAGDPEVSLEAGGAALVVAREPERARFTRLTRAELEALATLAAGRTLDDAAASWNDTGESLGALLARAVLRGWLV